MSRRALVGAFPDRVRISNFTREYMHNKDYRALIISLFMHSSRKLVLRKSKELNMRGSAFGDRRFGVQCAMGNGKCRYSEVGILSRQQGVSNTALYTTIYKATAGSGLWRARARLPAIAGCCSSK